MLISVAVTQVCVFLFFASLEVAFPNRDFPRAKYFSLWWCGVVIFSLVWVRGYFYFWADIPSLMHFDQNPIVVGFCFYFLYSFGNYWIHRFKHSNVILWKYFHRLHHSAAHMETAIAFFRHPIEILLNTIYIIVLGKLILGLSIEAICVALTIEGCLECFHHSNIKTPKKLRWLGHVIQIPEMHLVHHEMGLHGSNYSPFLWDTVFGTAVIPDEWDKRLGFLDSEDIGGYFWLKN